MLLVAAGPTPGPVAVGALPAVQANLLARRRAIIVAKLVVAGPTECGASIAIVIERAKHSDYHDDDYQGRRFVRGKNFNELENLREYQRHSGGSFCFFFKFTLT